MFASYSLYGDMQTMRPEFAGLRNVGPDVGYGLTV